MVVSGPPSSPSIPQSPLPSLLPPPLIPNTVSPSPPPIQGPLEVVCFASKTTGDDEDDFSSLLIGLSCAQTGGGRVAGGERQCAQPSIPSFYIHARWMCSSMVGAACRPSAQSRHARCPHAPSLLPTSRPFPLYTKPHTYHQSQPGPARGRPADRGGGDGCMSGSGRVWEHGWWQLGRKMEGGGRGGIVATQ